MESFDVEWLFTTVPVKETVQVRRVTMRPSHFDPMMLTPSQIAYPLDFLSRSKYFKYKKSNYKQQDDAATGIPALQQLHTST